MPTILQNKLYPQYVLCSVNIAGYKGALIEGMADRSAAQEDSGKGPMARERMQSK